jgi:hypothetical protein
MPDPAITAAFRKPFAQQVDFFRAKLGNLIPTQRWDEVWKGAHDTGFMVAGAMKADLLADFAGAVDKAIATGTSLGEFRRDFDAIVAKYGWSYIGERNWRSKVIYQTNISTSYAAGREAQITAAGFAYKMYKHSDSVANPRPHHVAWDGLVLPVDHPFWQTHSAPNGWGCKCRIIGIRNEAAARRLGGKWGDKPPAGWDQIDAKTGEPVGIDKGWGYQPGAESPLLKQIKTKAAKLPEPLGEALEADVEAASLRNKSLRQMVRDEPDTLKHLNMVSEFIGRNMSAKTTLIQNGTMATAEALHHIDFDGYRIYFKPDFVNGAHHVGNSHPVTYQIKEIIDTAMPRELKRHTKEIVLAAQSNVQDAYWQSLNPNFTTSLATAGSGRRVTVYNRHFVDADSLSHEMGHNLADQRWGSAYKIGPDFTAASQKDGFVSQYAEDAFAGSGYTENFAEAIAAFVTNESRLKRQQPAIWRVVDKILRDKGYAG